MKIRLSEEKICRHVLLNPMRNYYNRKMTKHGYRFSAPTREWYRHNKIRTSSPADKVILRKIKRLGGAM